MTQSKIQFKIGNLEFLGEGDEKWLSEQLDKLIDKLPNLVKIAPPPPTPAGGKPVIEDDQEVNTKDIPLATFLRNKNVGDSQVNRFLATAIWLYGRGTKTLSTNDVTKALKENQQPRLGNATDCLNLNVSKGYCEKQGKQFFITPTGFESMK
ncbi:MAG: hypothetical protein JNK81_13020 [Anaerolineales bacterium]|nr:hypothetical protein [Anaerolineales bacterium]